MKLRVKKGVVVVWVIYSRLPFRYFWGVMVFMVLCCCGCGGGLGCWRGESRLSV